MTNTNSDSLPDIIRPYTEDDVRKLQGSDPEVAPLCKESC